MPARNPSVVVTGANKGIGYFVAKALLGKGYDVVLACRDVDRATDAAEKLTRDTKAAKDRITIVPFDLEDTATLKTAASEVKKKFPDGVDAVVHNAAFAFKHDAPEPFHAQAEKTTKINFFNTMAAAHELLPTVKDGGRIVFVGSRAGLLNKIPGKAAREEFVKEGATYDSISKHVHAFVDAAKAKTLADHGWPENAYGTSKVALGSFVRLFAKDEAVTRRGIVANWCCPGWCKTDMGGEGANRSAEDGADTIVWLTTASDVGGNAAAGKFFGERKEVDWTAGTGKL